METAMSPALGSREEKKAFYLHALRITAPIALQNLMDAAVSSADIIMLSFVSQAALAASSLAGQVAFVQSMLFYGISSGAAVLGAQYWGKGDRRSVEKIMGLSLRIAIIVGLLFTVAAAFAPGLIMRFFTDDPELIGNGVQYLRAVSLSYLLGDFCTVYLAVMRSVERVRMSAAVHSSSVAANVLLNACFIFGIGPFPQLGIVGVALATSITRALEFIVCIIDGRLCREIRLRLADIFRKAGTLMKDFFRIAIPAAANDMIWGLAFSVYSVILGHLSSDIVAANSVASVVRNLGTVVCFGVSNSAGIILGKAMGDSRLKEAEAWAARFIRLALWTAVAGGILILCCRPLVLKFMYLYVTVTDTVTSELSMMLIINSYYILGSSINTMLICGVFRAGGDTKYGLYMDIVSMWGYAVPIGLLCAFVFRIPEMAVYFVLCLDEFVKMPFIFLHYRKKKWLCNITRENAD